MTSSNEIFMNRLRHIQDTAASLDVSVYGPDARKSMRAVVGTWRPSSKKPHALRDVERIVNGIVPTAPADERRMAIIRTDIEALRRDVMTEARRLLMEAALICSEHGDETVRASVGPLDEAAEDIGRWMLREWNPAKAAADVSTNMMRAAVGLVEYAGAIDADMDGLSQAYTAKSLASAAYALFESLL